MYFYLVALLVVVVMIRIPQGRDGALHADAVKHPTMYTSTTSRVALLVVLVVLVILAGIIHISIMTYTYCESQYLERFLSLIAFYDYLYIGISLTRVHGY